MEKRTKRLLPGYIALAIGFIVYFVITIQNVANSRSNLDIISSVESKDELIFPAVSFCSVPSESYLQFGPQHCKVVDSNANEISTCDQVFGDAYSNVKCYHHNLDGNQKATRTSDMLEIAFLAENDNLNPNGPVIVETFLYDPNLFDGNFPVTESEFNIIRSNAFYVSRPNQNNAGSFAHISIEKTKFIYPFTFPDKTFVNYTSSVSQADLTNTLNGQIRVRIVYAFMEEQVKTETWTFGIFTAISAIGGALGIVSSIKDVMLYIYDKIYPETAEGEQDP